MYSFNPDDPFQGNRGSSSSRYVDSFWKFDNKGSSESVARILTGVHNNNYTLGSDSSQDSSEKHELTIKRIKLFCKKSSNNLPSNRNKNLIRTGMKKLKEILNKDEIKKMESIINPKQMFVAAKELAFSLALFACFNKHRDLSSVQESIRDFIKKLDISNKNKHCLDKEANKIYRDLFLICKFDISELESEINRNCHETIKSEFEKIKRKLKNNTNPSFIREYQETIEHYYAKRIFEISEQKSQNEILNIYHKINFTNNLANSIPTIFNQNEDEQCKII